MYTMLRPPGSIMTTHTPAGVLIIPLGGNARHERGFSKGTFST